MLATALRGYCRDGSFHDLEKGLLHALARHVAGDPGVVGLALILSISLPREFGFLIPIGFRHAPGQTTDAVSNPRGFYSTSRLVP